MEHVYATLLLNEANGELNEENLTAVLEAAGCSVVESRTKALVAALEGVDVDRIGDAAIGADGTGASGDHDTGAVAVGPDEADGASDAGEWFTGVDIASGGATGDENAPDGDSDVER